MLRNLIEQLTSKRFGPRRQRSRQSRRIAFHRSLSCGLQVESLEDRVVLASAVLGVEGALVINNDGTEANDFVLTRDGENLVVRDNNNFVNGSDEVAFLFADVSSIEINAHGGDDWLTIDLRQGNAIPAGGIDYFGGDNDTPTGDGLTVIGDGVATEATYTPDAAVFGKGMIDIGNGDGSSATIMFADLEPVDMFGMATATLITPPDSNDTLTLSNGKGFTQPGDAILVSGTLGDSSVGARDGVPIETVAFGGNGQVIIDTSPADPSSGSDGNDRVFVDSADNMHNNANLTITTGQGDDDVDVNGNIVLAGDLRVQTQDISLGGQIAVIGLVSLDAGAGSIVDDLPGDAPSVTSMAAALRAANGIGDTDDLNTAISVLVANNTIAGDIQISNVVGGLLTIGMLEGLSGASNGAPGSAVVISNAGPLTINSNITANGEITITTADTATSDERLTVSNGATVGSTGGNVTLRGGDDVIIENGSTIDAAGTARIEGDFGDADSDQGSVIDILGTLKSVNRAVVLGAAGSDSITLDPNAGSSGDILLNGQGGIDHYFVQLGNLGGQVDVDDQAGELDDLTITGTDNAETVTVNATSTSGGGETVTYTPEIDFLTVLTLGGADTIDVTPSGTLGIDIFGGDPTAAPGDTLNFSVPPLHTSTLTNPGPGRGTIETTGPGNFLRVAFAEIESLNLNNPPVAQASSVMTNEDTAKTFDVTDFQFTDVEGDGLASVTVSNLILAAGDTLTVDQGAGATPVTNGVTITAAQIPSLTYAPAADANGAARSTFGFAVNDVDSGIVTATMTINVKAVNDEPAGTDKTITIDEDSTYKFVAGDFGFSDAHDSPPNALASVTISNLSLGGGTLKLGGTDVIDSETIAVALIESLVYAPAADQNGTGVATFDFVVTDDGGTAGTGAVDTDQSANTITFDVTSIADVPDIIVGGNDSKAESLTETNAGLTSGGTLSVTDPDATDTVSAAVDNVAVSGTGADSVPGSLTTAILKDFMSVNDGDVLDNASTSGTITWAFDSGSEPFNFLAAGETLVLTYTISATDAPAGASDTQDVVITITGTNDDPVIMDAPNDADGQVLIETNGGLMSSGTLAVEDPDTTDIVNASVDVVVVTGDDNGLGNTALLAMMRLGTNPVIDSSSATGTINWSFDSGSEAFDYLALGESLTLEYTLRATDSKTASDTATLTILISGTNDDPIVDAADVTGAVTELITPSGNLTDSGTIGFSDLDLNDVHSINDTITASAGALGTLTASVTSDTTGTGTRGVISWNYTMAAADVAHLAQDETKVETFNITLDDGSGGTVDRLITITITGTDAAVRVEDVSAAEGGGLMFTVILDNAVQGAFTVDVTLTDATAMGGAAALVYPEDYNNVVAQLNFIGTAGETQQFTVATLDDAVVERQETFTVSLSSSHALVDASDTAMGTIIDNDLLLVEFSQSAGMDVESSGGNLPQLLVTGTIQAGHSVTIDAAVVGGTATGGGVDYNEPTTVTIPAGTYNTTAFAITGLSVTPDTLIESDETIDFGMLTGSQIQVGDADGDGTTQSSTQYTILDDDIPRTAVRLENESHFTIRDVVPGGKDDQLVLTIVGDRLVITDPNNLVGDYTDNTTGNSVDIALASILSIEINLLEGDDQLSINFDGAPSGFSLSVTINGGGGQDTLTFTGPTPLGSGALRTNGGVEDILVNGPITTVGGAVTLTATHGIEVNANIDTGDRADVRLTAEEHDIFGNCSLIQTGSADVHLSSATGLAGVRVQTVGDVTLDGGNGGIVGCTGEIAVSAATLGLTADASVGTGLRIAGQTAVVEPFLTSVDAIYGTVGGLGIFLINDRSLTDNVVLAGLPPLGVRNVCAGTGCASSEGEGSPLQNAGNRLDVNNDGAVSPIDALAVVNFLSGEEAHSEGPRSNRGMLYVDVNGDYAVSPVDALAVINHLNRIHLLTAEGESSGLGQVEIEMSERSSLPLSVIFVTALDSDFGRQDGQQISTTAAARQESVRHESTKIGGWPTSRHSLPSVTQVEPEHGPRLRPLIASQEADDEFEQLLAQIAPDVGAVWC